MHDNRLAKTALGFAVFAFRQMAFASLGSEQLAGTGDFETFRGGFARLIAWSSLWHGKRDGKITEFQQVAMKTLKIPTAKKFSRPVNPTSATPLPLRFCPI